MIRMIQGIEPHDDLLIGYKYRVWGGTYGSVPEYRETHHGGKQQHAAKNVS